MQRRGVYAITPDQQDRDLLFSMVEQALQGGIALLQYRDKISSAEEMLLRANALHELCLKYQTPLIINDSPELALACHAEGVHLGQGDSSIEYARDLLGKKAIIGITCHHQLDLAMQAEKGGANYIAFGRFYNSTTKPGAALATLELLESAIKQLSLPIVAIGGINQTNCQPLIDNGVSYIASVEQIFSASNIKENCRLLSRLFTL